MTDPADWISPPEDDPDLPTTWVVICCDNHTCLETWTVDVEDFDPPLTATAVRYLLLPDLIEHDQSHAE